MVLSENYISYRYRIGMVEQYGGTIMKKKLSIAVLLILTATLVFAQQAIRVEPGMIFGYMHEGLNEFDGHRGQEYLIRVEADSSYQIDVMSEDFDAYVVVYHPDGTREFNDDGGDGLNARIVVTPATSGDMRVIARGWRSDPVGNYLLEVASAGGGAAGIQEIDLGTHFGTLGAGSGYHEDYRADEYHLQVRDGQGLQIDVMSDDFDAYVVILHPDGTREFDDDGGFGLDAQLRTTVRGNGVMRVFARSWHREPVGDYTLDLQPIQMTTVPAISIRPGRHEGTIDSSSAQYEGYTGVEYEVSVRGGVTYQVDVMSDDFDAYVVVFHPDGTREFNDDGGDGFDARLRTTPRTDGTMRIIARGWRRDPIGDFTLLVEDVSRTR
ncbi:MAG: hypothetical protein EA383_16720 [Spirochaetaceae bacterium]|nr:MAG: hypothetical protein EA383_16720 [Spirochaetaceae bacterium]